MNIKKISIIGMGYVGLPLARLFAKKYNVVGYDIDETRIHQLKNGHDKTNELTKEDLLEVLITNDVENEVGLFPTNGTIDLYDTDVFIITVPTPVDENNVPDLKPLIAATTQVSRRMKKGSIIIYESTVYPTTTEEICVPILEENKGNFKYNVDFGVGYSPERINPADKTHTVENIVKITSGSNEHYAQVIDDLYNGILKNGTFKAASIKVAEAAKVIENAQRDVNIAFVNELAKIFNLMDINTNDVLNAAGSKWNFLKFKQGLVGGHCIGVDPFYLAKKAQDFKYNPEIILTSRRINDSMGKYVANEVVKKMTQANIGVCDSNILIVGFTFKENCSDIRNTKVIDIYNELKSWNCEVDVFDNFADKKDVKEYYNIDLIGKLGVSYDAIILAVAHDDLVEYFNDPLNIESLTYTNYIIYDVKGVIKIDSPNIYQL